eukprot:Seg13155.1 transcript_id=Seg13155.1/GoldUCD/mRNA.D3Y31 product="hypothetical protein" protein_id=Seg13155.1/GoldUCD/D3Y31
MYKKRVGIIIGHRPSAKGAKNAKAGVYEFDYWNDFAKKLEKCLKQRGEIEPVLIYRGDHRGSYGVLPDLVDRKRCDFLVSLHANAYNGKASGSEMLYCSKNGKKLALRLMAASSVLGLKHRGVKWRDEEHRGGHLLWNTKAPCVISEPFFIDNDHDYAVAVRRKTDLVIAYASNLEGYAKDMK